MFLSGLSETLVALCYYKTCRKKGCSCQICQRLWLHYVAIKRAERKGVPVRSVRLWLHYVTIKHAERKAVPVSDTATCPQDTRPCLRTYRDPKRFPSQFQKPFHATTFQHEILKHFQCYHLIDQLHSMFCGLFLEIA